MNIFQSYCEKLNYYPDIEIETEVTEKNNNETKVLYHWYLGELVAIESEKGSKNRLIFTEKGRKMFNRLALYTFKRNLL